jgi:CoA:oxalate CoA-transferase
METQDSSLPLSGIVVLDLTRVLAGPYCTRLLCRHGRAGHQGRAPRLGRRHPARPAPDRARTAGPEQLLHARERRQGERGHRSVQRGGHGGAARPGAPAPTSSSRTSRPAWSRGWAATTRPCGPSSRTSSTARSPATGRPGPWCNRPAFAHTTNAMSGLMHLEQGDGTQPRASNLQAADVLAATQASGRSSAGLFRRNRTGQGAHIDVSMLEALIGADSVAYPSVLNGGEGATATRAPAWSCTGSAGVTWRCRSWARPISGGASWQLMKRPELNHRSALRRVGRGRLEATGPRCAI